MQKGKISASLVPEAPDPVRDRLWVAWRETRDAWAAEGFPTSSQAQKAHDFVDEKLKAHLWNKAKAAIEADRQKHPKARRNAPVGSEKPGAGGRFLP